MATLKYYKMKKPIMNSVMLLRFARACKRALAFVNVFKKKNCGAFRLKAKNYFESLNWEKKFLFGYFAGSVIIIIVRVLL